MDCEQRRGLTNDQIIDRFYDKMVAHRVPFYGGADLTRRCNLRCLHCYIRPLHGNGSGDHELTGGQWRRIIDEVVDAGCLYFLITGGEPLMRPDFGEIYSHAKRSGLLVTVFTNGTRITADTLDLFADLPPHCVEITLYGATAGTYEAITGVGGSYRKCLEGIEGLLGRGVNLGLKTILMRPNLHEIGDIRKMAEEFGVGFRLDAAIFPRFDGDRAPVDLRVRPEEAVAAELSDPDYLDELRRLLERQRTLPLSDSLYECGAAQTNFHIDASGILKPCIMVREPACDVAGGGFRRGWNEVLPQLRERRPSPDYACKNCEKKGVCEYCPSFFAIETGDENCYSHYLCDMGGLRFKAVMGA